MKEEVYRDALLGLVYLYDLKVTLSTKTRRVVYTAFNLGRLEIMGNVPEKVRYKSLLTFLKKIGLKK